MKNFIIAIALMFSAFTFAQTSQGTWTFGIGDNFTSVPNGHEANAGYFVMDGVMVSLGFHMMTETADGADDAHTDWAIGARYYIGEDGLWAGAGMNNATDADGEDAMDMNLMVGCSKALGFDGKLWFEPCVMLEMPAANDSMHLGLGMGFRFAF